MSRVPASRLGTGAGWLAAVRAYGELRNLRLVARLVAATALAREESRGAHFRRDHPDHPARVAAPPDAHAGRAGTRHREGRMTLPAILVEPLIRAALAEDLGRAGDLTTELTIPPGTRARALLRARRSGRIAGLDAALLAFRLLGPRLAIEVGVPDGADAAPGDTIAIVDGDARAILAAERTALNLLTRLCGIATATREAVARVAGTKARIACTRKTTPGLRALEKHAVRMGGGMNHRFGLDDGVLIKDNHIVAAGGILAAVDRARAGIGHMVKLEVEVDTLDQLQLVLTRKVDAVLLDNMAPPTLREAVALVAGRCLTEASGGIRPETLPEIAATGVDIISLGWLTHSAPGLDIGLDLEPL